MYVNKADDGVGKLCFYQPNKAFSVFVIRVQTLHIICKDILYEKME